MNIALNTSYPPAPLHQFVRGLTLAIETFDGNETALLQEAGSLMRVLVQNDNWLPAACAKPDDTHYQQHLLYGDPLDRFSVVSFVWGPGQMTPVHNHTVWGVIGMLRGGEVADAFELDTSSGRLVNTGTETLRPGDVAMVSPAIGDIHQVRNACDDLVSVSIHAYGANIGKVTRHIFTPDGGKKDFVSGYSNTLVPNLWTTPDKQ